MINQNDERSLSSEIPLLNPLKMITLELIK